MTALFWVPYIFNRMLEQGIGRAIWDPYGDTGTQVAWAKRMMQSHQNAVENLVLFALLVIVVQLTGNNTDITELACMIFSLPVYCITWCLPLPSWCCVSSAL